MKTGHFYFGKNQTFLNWLDTENFYQVRPIWKYPAFWKAEMSGFHGLGTIRICGLHLP